MGTGAFNGTDRLSPATKRDALQAALSSKTLAPSPQLCAILRYVCEREIEGRAGEITEYTIGVDVLRRPEGYSSVEDPSVRKRAYELRQKLKVLYSTELATSSVKIEMPKGSYVPQFRGEVASMPESAPGEPGPPSPARRVGAAWQMAGLLAVGMLLGSGTVALIRSGAPGIDPVLAEAWGPLARPGADPVICAATNLHLIVRPYAERQTPQRYPAFPELYDAFRKHRPLPDGVKLEMYVADNSVSFGEVAASVLVGNALRSFGSSYQLLPESVTPFITLRNRNAVVIGVPYDSLAVTKLLASTPFTLEYDKSVGDQAIIDRRRPAQDRVAFKNGPHVYGLLTVLPSEGSNGAKRTVVISGIGSPGGHAVADFFSSPDRLREFQNRLRAEGHQKLPSAYQVVLRSSWSENLMVSYEYVAHAVIAR